MVAGTLLSLVVIAYAVAPDVTHDTPIPSTYAVGGTTGVSVTFHVSDPDSAPDDVSTTRYVMPTCTNWQSITFNSAAGDDADDAAPTIFDVGVTLTIPSDVSGTVKVRCRASDGSSSYRDTASITPGS